MNKVNLAEEFSRFSDHWQPKIAGDALSTREPVVSRAGKVSDVTRPAQVKIRHYCRSVQSTDIECQWEKIQL